MWNAVKFLQSCLKSSWVARWWAMNVTESVKLCIVVLTHQVTESVHRRAGLPEQGCSQNPFGSCYSQNLDKTLPKPVKRRLTRLHGAHFEALDEAHPPEFCKKRFRYILSPIQKNRLFAVSKLWQKVFCHPTSAVSTSRERQAQKNSLFGTNEL
jgi:hypothetical protein